MLICPGQRYTKTNARIKRNTESNPYIQSGGDFFYNCHIYFFSNKEKTRVRSQNYPKIKKHGRFISKLSETELAYLSLKTMKPHKLCVFFFGLLSLRDNHR